MRSMRGDMRSTKIAPVLSTKTTPASSSSTTERASTSSARARGSRSSTSARGSTTGEGTRSTTERVRWIRCGDDLTGMPRQSYAHCHVPRRQLRDRSLLRYLAGVRVHESIPDPELHVPIPSSPVEILSRDAAVRKQERNDSSVARLAAIIQSLLESIRAGIDEEVAAKLYDVMCWISSRGNTTSAKPSSLESVEKRCSS